MISNRENMPWKKAGSESGVALVLAIGVVALLTVVALEFQRFSVLQVAMAANFENSIKALCAARSGVQVALSLIEKDGKENTSDSFFDSWGDLEESVGDVKSLFPDAEWELKVTPVNARLNINMLVDNTGKFVPAQKDLWMRILAGGKLLIGDAEPEDILNAIKDWIDPDDEPTGFGAEEDYYAGLPRPYHCKNAPLTTTGELLMIKGITSQLYYGDENHIGLKQIVAVYGSGKINLNVAPAALIRVLAPEIDDDMVEELIQYREDPSHRDDLSNPSWYKNVPGWATLELPKNIITVKSKYFKVKSVAKVRYSKKVASAVVYRDESVPRIVFWKVK